MKAMQVQRKRVGGYKISPRREVIEQNRLRNSMERKVKLQLMTAFAEVGSLASDAHMEGRGVETLLISVTRKIRDVLVPHYRNVIEEFGTRIIRNRKADTNFEQYLNFYLNMVGGKRITNVSESTINKVRSIILKQEVDGQGVRATSRAIFKGMTGSFSKRRSAVIARTETHTASSYAQHRMNESLEIPNQKKRWVTVSDNRSRSWHRNMNGVEVDINEDFDVVVKGINYKMKHTGDPRGGASNVINCRCITIYIDPDDEVIDDKPPVDKPIKPIVPAKPPKPKVIITPPEIINEINPNPYSSPRYSGFTSATMKVVKKSVAVKRLTEQFKKNYEDGLESGAYERRTRYKSSTTEKFGNAERLLGGGKDKFTDESASFILGIMPEINALTDRFKIPRLRSVDKLRDTSDGRLMSMGDGKLNLDAHWLNQHTMPDRKPTRIEIENNNANVEAILAERLKTTKLEAEMKISSVEANRVKKEFGFTSQEYKKAYSDYAIAYNTYVDSFNKGNKLKRKVKTFEENFDDTPIVPSTWKQGDGFGEDNNQPWFIADYEKTKFDRARALVYHEMAHHVHQYWKIKNPEIGVSRFLKPFRPLEETLERFHRPSSRSTHQISQYGQYNQSEWFAENFAAYFMDKKELVDPSFIKLIETILKEIHG
jgi:hypothetical protein